jgi:hypothetical protein
LRARLWGLEDDVAAGDVGLDGFEAGGFAEGFELGHGQLAGAADVDGAEERDEGGHLLFLHCADGLGEGEIGWVCAERVVMKRQRRRIERRISLYD